MSWQRIYAKGYRPRQLFTGNQAGKGTAQSAPMLTGRGNYPEEQRHNVLVATASARAAQALQAADDANKKTMMTQKQWHRLCKRPHRPLTMCLLFKLWQTGRRWSSPSSNWEGEWQEPSFSGSNEKGQAYRSRRTTRALCSKRKKGHRETSSVVLCR